MARKEGVLAAYADEQYRKQAFSREMQIAFLDKKYLAVPEKIADVE